MTEWVLGKRGIFSGGEIASRYLGLIRFSHTIFALPFAMLATVWAFVVPLPTSGVGAAAAAGGDFLAFRWWEFVGILACMVFARSFAMAMNRFLDRDIDWLNPRTAGRHLPAGLLTPNQVLRFGVCCAVLFIASCLLFLPNTLPVMLSVPVLLFLAGYSLAKRFTQWVHFWLGCALMLAPICVWIALRGEAVQRDVFDLLPAVWLGMVVLLWVSGFDIIYACQDEAFDRGAGLYSIPSRLGIPGALRLASGCHALMWCLAMGMSIWIPALSLGWIFRGMLIVVGGLLIMEHFVISSKSMARIQLAFFQLNAVISVLFLIFGGLDAYWR
jgi:4-hydroxybenzoate polyprenyltransferase